MRRAAARAQDVDERPLLCSRELLQLRVVSRRLEPEARPLPGDGRSRTLADILLSPLHTGPERALRRLAIAFWCLATLTAPMPVARLIAMRYGARR